MPSNENMFISGWFSTLPSILKILLIYAIIINVAAFFYFGWDKMRSQLHSDRISEKTLWFLTIIGGSIGALLGMNYFRHKTKKLSFQAVLAIILVMQIWLAYIIIK